MVPDMMHTFVIFRVRPNNKEEFEAIHRRLLAHTCGMPGCIEVDVHRSAREPFEYMVHGRWGRARPRWIGHIKRGLSSATYCTAANRAA